METGCWMCQGTEEMIDTTGTTIPCLVCQPDACDVACATLNAATAQPLPIPTTPRHGTVNYFPRKPSSFATTDLTGASAATMEATIRRDFGRFLGGTTMKHELVIDLDPMRPTHDVLEELKQAAAVIASAAADWEQSPRDFFDHLMADLEGELNAALPDDEASYSWG